MYNNPPAQSTTMPVGEAGGSHVMGDYSIPTGNGSGGPSNPYGEDPIEALKRQQEQMEQRKQDVYATLARTIESTLVARMGTRKAKENQWLEAMRVYLGSLSSYNIVTGEYPFGTKADDRLVHRPEFNICRSKCRMAIAQTISYQFSAGDKNWNLRTPASIYLDPQDYQAAVQQMQDPNLSPDEVVELKVDAMEREIEYHLECTHYPREIRKAMHDWVILGTGVMKGPLNAGKMKKVYQKQQTSDGRIIRVPSFSLENVPLLYRVNLWYWFPDDTVTDVDKAENSCEVHPLSKQELNDLIKHPGYMGDQIKLCLAEDPKQYTNSPFNDPAYLTQGINLLKNKYLVIEYHGPIKKEDLNILGVQSTDETPYDEVYGEIWVCNGRIIRLQLSTLEGCNRIPYYAAVWEPDPATIFGFGIPMLSRDQQRVVNESYKMVLDNAGISAGPQVVVDTTLIKPADGEMECTPFKVWYIQEYGADANKAIQFFTPPNSFEGLAALISLARSFADEESGITLIQNDITLPTQAQDSATGMAIKDENAQAPLFLQAERWDDDITHPIIDAMYDWEMQYSPKEEIKCDVEIDVRSSTQYLKGLMDQQKLDRLMQEISQGSPIAKWINLDELILARLSSMKLPSHAIIKSPQQVAQDEAKAAQQPPQPDPNMLKAQAAILMAQNQQQEIAQKAQQMQFDQQRHQDDMQYKWQIQHDTNAANVQSHVLDVKKAEVQSQGTMAQGYSQHQLGALQLQTELAKTSMQENTKKQLAGMDHVQTAAEIASNEKIQNAKNEAKLREVRVNAAARKQAIPNRNLTKHNPKPSN